MTTQIKNKQGLVRVLITKENGEEQHYWVSPESAKKNENGKASGATKKDHTESLRALSEDDMFAPSDVGARVLTKGLSKKEREMLYTPMDFDHPLLASYRVTNAEKDILEAYAAKKNLDVQPDELNLIKLFSWGEISPNRFKRYATLRGKDINPNSKSRKVSFEEMSAFAKLGITNVSEVEELLNKNIRPEDIASFTKADGFQLRPEWKEWQNTGKAVIFSHVSFGGGRVQLPIRETEFAFIDLETSGTDKNASVIEIAIRRVRGDGTLISTLDTLVDPGAKRKFMGDDVDVYQEVQDTSHVHKIVPEDLNGAPTFEELSETIKEHLDGAVVVAQNDRFEQGRLSYEFSRMGEMLPAFSSFDTLKVGKMLFNFSGEDVKLGNMYQNLTGKKLKGAHEAMADTKATEKVAFEMFDHLEKYGVSTLGAMSPPPVGIAKPHQKPKLKKRGK